jgi:hypothetical protein
MDKPNGTQLYDNNPKGPPKMRSFYRNASSARVTVKRLRKKTLPYQKQVATTMYYRAKHHKYQTKKMRNAMKVYKSFLNTL